MGQRYSRVCMCMEFGDAVSLGLVGRTGLWPCALGRGGCLQIGALLMWILRGGQGVRDS